MPHIIFLDKITFFCFFFKLLFMPRCGISFSGNEFQHLFEKRDIEKMGAPDDASIDFGATKRVITICCYS